MSALQSLLVRVESATGPDRELDLAVHVTLFPKSEIAQIVSGSIEVEKHWLHPTGGLTFRTANGSGALPLPPITASLDAALALCERMLPGWYRFVGDLDLRGLRACATLAMGYPDQPAYRGWAPHGQYALALLCALLKALVAQGEDGKL